MAAMGEISGQSTEFLPTAEQQITNEGSKGIKVAAKSTPKRKDYRKIHALPLPLVIHSLPPLIPHNPVSLVHIAYVYLRQLIWSPSSVPTPLYVGVFSKDSQSIHVFDRHSISGLWSRGFFGKGSLSRSEPTWLEREKRRRGLLATETSEEYTRQRRDERRAMKLERARKEQEAIEQTLKIEVGSLPLASDSGRTATRDVENFAMQERKVAADIDLLNDGRTANSSLILEDDELLESDFRNEEHLQLTLEEAFFLATALGVLEVKDEANGNTIPLEFLLSLFMNTYIVQTLHSAPVDMIQPDNPFIVSYVAYHHFRSLGWVVRAGNKFSVDFLLYLRGPVFSHAEFAVAVMPAYEHEFWTDKGREMQKPWHWFHMVNRVQSSVRKTLIFCYVDIPPPSVELFNDKGDLSTILKEYRVREFVLKRWSPNRNRE